MGICAESEYKFNQIFLNYWYTVHCALCCSKGYSQIREVRQMQVAYMIILSKVNTQDSLSPNITYYRV